jgi:hypothetical protein
MTEFERTIVNSFNAHFKQNSIRALAYRLKQHRFTSQFLDVLVDSINPELYLGIECKSISVEKGASALYFSQHFTVDKKGVHQIERISNYLNSTGRRGYLAVELRMGVGKSRQAHLVPWDVVEKKYLDQNLKITLDEIRSYPEMKRAGSLYLVAGIIEKEHTQMMPYSLS